MNPKGVPKGIQRPGRMGLVKYAQIFAAVFHEPKTHLQVAAEVGRGEQSLRELLWRMQHQGIVHVTGWVKVSRSIHMPLFKAGAGPSVPYPTPRKRNPGAFSAVNMRPELVHFAKIIQCLMDGCTVVEAHEQTGVAKMRFGHVVTALRKAKILRIADWQKNESGCGQPARVFEIGQGPDAPRPKRVTDQERNKRHTDREKAKRATKHVIDAITRSGASAQRLGIKPYHMLGKSSVPV